jgi:hypothetical protein
MFPPQQIPGLGPDRHIQQQAGIGLGHGAGSAVFGSQEADGETDLPHTGPDQFQLLAGEKPVAPFDQSAPGLINPQHHADEVVTASITGVAGMQLRILRAE